MKEVIAIIDIGKTNKKIFLFDKNFDVVFKDYMRFEEIKDDDGYPCDDIESIQQWIKDQIARIQEMNEFKIKAINFTTHGATLVYLNKKGERVTPVYNYLKPLDVKDFDFLYEANDGVEEFSRKTASPSYGMLNTGMQMLSIKYKKPHFWKEIDAILHYPQYLSYLFTKEVTADFTSVGAHTATWDFDTMQYHEWLKSEGIQLPAPVNGKKAIMANINGETIAVGSGLHDSSSSIIPLLEKEKDQKFILLSTGTWIIAMNPFSKETLTQTQLKNNCLCFMTPEKQQIKSSMQFLGRIHEVYLEVLSKHFNVSIDTYLELELNTALCSKLIEQNKRIFLAEGIDTVFEAQIGLLENFHTYEEAYYQLVYEICKKVVAGIDLILDKDATATNIYISGGFNRNDVFVTILNLLRPKASIKISEAKNESALGAALLMKAYL
jgi:sugar (pentulose or hexulose) kinase